MKNVSKRFKIKELKNSERKTEYVMEVKNKSQNRSLSGSV
jgi:hypothetical protein